MREREFPFVLFTLLVDIYFVIFLAVDDYWMKMIDVGGLSAAVFENE